MEIKALFATGHRPIPKVYEYSIAHPTRQEIRRRIELALVDAITVGGFNTFVSGMALGFDVDFALTVLRLRDDLKVAGIYLTCAIPFKNWDVQWHKDDVAVYNKILDAANNVTTVCEPGFAKWKYMERNKFMVNFAQQGLCLWNGTAGGTCNTIAYAIEQNKPIINLLTADVTTAPQVMKLASNQRNWQRRYAQKQPAA